MSAPKNAMEVFQHLEKSNCRDCGEKTCLAFAGAVFQGRRALSECPRLDPEVIRRFAPSGGADGGDDGIEQLKAAVANIDLSAAAARLGARYENGRLTLKVLGKDFSVDASGVIRTDIHVNPWVAAPFLMHVLHGEGAAPTGNWVSFRELSGGKERYPLFQKRCEEPLKRVADVYTELFDDMVHLFSGRQVEEQFASDIAVALHPLPKVPMMICYWKPEDGIDSTLNLFFDETADRNLDIGTIFSLGAGFTQMIERLAVRHGYKVEG